MNVKPSHCYNWHDTGLFFSGGIMWSARPSGLSRPAPISARTILEPQRRDDQMTTIFGFQGLGKFYIKLPTYSAHSPSHSAYLASEKTDHDRL